MVLGETLDCAPHACLCLSGDFSTGVLPRKSGSHISMGWLIPVCRPDLFNPCGVFLKKSLFKNKEIVVTRSYGVGVKVRLK